MGRLVVVLAALVAFALAATSAGAAFPGANGNLGYGWFRLDEPELGPFRYEKGIRLIAPRGGEPRTVTGCEQTVPIVHVLPPVPPPAPPTGTCVAATYANPAFSADGARIAFDRGASLALVATADGAVTTLPAHSDDDGEAAFSAGGGRLAFSAGPSVSTPESAQRGIWVRNLVTGAATQATQRGTDPEWSSRNWIAFQRRGQIWRVRPGGRELERLTGRGGISPAWSPHGTKLAFVRHGTIAVLDLRTRRLARAIGGNSPVDVAWSPDGRRLAWTSFDGGLYVAQTDGTAMRALVAGGVNGTTSFGTAGVDWQPRR
jgi:Tol biopolymer transport system component